MAVVSLSIADGRNEYSTAVNVNNLMKQLEGTSSGGAWRWTLPFQMFTTLLLSLLLPLSFLLLARLSAAHYLSVVGNSTTSTATTFLLMYNGKSISIVLYALVSLLTVAAFVQGLTAAPLKLIPGLGPTSTRLYLAWALLCTFQVCVGLGVEGTISAGIDGSGFANESCNNFPVIVTRALLLLGLHETMAFWSITVVKPVVEDTVGVGPPLSILYLTTTNGFSTRRVVVVVERVGVALSLGALWWWRLRDEVDALVVVPELMLAGGGVSTGRGADHVVVAGWWLYYVAVSIGTVRVLKAAIWVGIPVVSSPAVVDQEEKSQVDDETTSDSVSQSHHHPRHLQLPLEDIV